ncbi:MAG: macro domain-containing protein [Nanoarchaeota archaeon]|nr:macro domain-containing protein [Nanoarchaeota archaeon]
MIEQIGNMWSFLYRTDYCICLTTNGNVKKNGEAVMGKGIAAQAKARFPSLPIMIAQRLEQCGNHVDVLHIYDLHNEQEAHIAIFPTKNNWWEKSDIDLIHRSAQELAEIARTNPNTTFVLPTPGCGNGGLDYADVRPRLECLPDNVIVISNNPRIFD